MKYISLPTSEVRPLSFYLAMEDYLAQDMGGEEDCLFMWQVEPSVIYGTRHQGLSAEEWRWLCVCRQGQPDAVVRDERGERRLRLQPFHDDGAVGAPQDGHRGYGHEP